MVAILHHCKSAKRGVSALFCLLTPKSLIRRFQHFNSWIVIGSKQLAVLCRFSPCGLAQQLLQYWKHSKTDTDLKFTLSLATSKAQVTHKFYTKYVFTYAGAEMGYLQCLLNCALFLYARSDDMACAPHHH